MGAREHEPMCCSDDFGPKKDGTWKKYTECRPINNIPKLNDLLDELHDACIFSMINLKNGYHEIRIREGDE